MAGIIRALKHGQNANTVWGTDEDGAFLLSEYAVDFAYIESSPDEVKINVMTAVKLGGDESQADTLAYQLGQIIEHQGEHAFEVAFLFNCDNKHWCAVKFKVDEYAIAEATYFDPMKKVVSQDAVKWVQNLVNKINDHKLIKVRVETGSHDNGYSCLDYSAKQILEWKEVSNAITHARSSEGLRQAVVSACEKHPSINAFSSESESESDAEASFSSEDNIATLDAADPIQFEENLHLQLSNKVYEERQIKFDEIMARRVYSLFQEKPEMDEKDLFRQAREEAFNELFKSQGN